MLPRSAALGVTLCAVLLFASPLCGNSEQAAPLTDEQAMVMHRRIMRGSQPGILLQRAGLKAGMVEFAGIPSRLEVVAEPGAFGFLEWLFCGEAFAAVGRFGPASSHRADDDSAIFSVRRFVIEEVVRPHALASHVPGDEVRVLTYGGAVRINDRTISDDTPTIGPERHLAVLNRFIPATGAYISVLWAYALPKDGRVVSVNLPKEPAVERLRQRELISIAKTAAAGLQASCTPKPITKR